MTKFEIGREYFTRSIGDADCIFSGIVVKRTAKTVTMVLEDGERVSRRVFLLDGVECVHPHGRYSQAPTLRADRTERPETGRAAKPLQRKGPKTVWTLSYETVVAGSKS